MRTLFTLLVFMVVAISSPTVAMEPIDVSLVNGGYSGNGNTALLGVRIEMPPEWHTYWKTPGEGGFPPEIDTSGSENLSGFEIAWPSPERIETPTGGSPILQTNGYRDTVVLPVLVTPTDKRRPVKIRLGLRVYACKDFCSAFERELSADLSPGKANSAAQKEIARWLTRVPKSTGGGLEISSPEPMQDGRFKVVVSSPSRLVSPWVHVGNEPNTPYSIETEKVDDGKQAFVVTPHGGVFPSSAPIEIVAVSGTSSVSRSFTLISPAPSIDLAMVLTAFLGGLILNLMPCVFPVLSLKLMALTYADTRKTRIGFAGASLGILLSFMGLAAIVVAMKLAGTQVGWGVQFQSAWFLGAMFLVVTLFAVGTAGLFEISLSSGTATFLSRITNGQTFGSSVAQGFVATLLATPCSAPFVGTAVGFALAGTSLDVFAIFLAMGTGMALPYIVLAALPLTARIMPKPGRWMNTVRLVLSAALFATAGWLLATLATLTSDYAYVLFGAVIVGLSVLTMKNRHRKEWAFAAVAVICFALPIVSARMPSQGGPDIEWATFDPDAIPALVSEGKTVVVSMTAQWCITCKVNDKTTWETPQVIEALSGSVVPMKGDWTKPDPRIYDFLKSHGRYGIPFTVVYAPTAPDGTVLPDVLTPSIVLSAVGID